MLEVKKTGDDTDTRDLSADSLPFDGLVENPRYAESSEEDSCRFRIKSSETGSTTLCTRTGFKIEGQDRTKTRHSLTK